MSEDSHKLYNKHFLLLMLQYGSNAPGLGLLDCKLIWLSHYWSDYLEVLNEIKNKNQFTCNSVIVKSLLYSPDTIAKKPGAFRLTINYPSDAFLFSVQHKEVQHNYLILKRQRVNYLMYLSCDSHLHVKNKLSI